MAFKYDDENKYSQDDRELPKHIIKRHTNDFEISRRAQSEDFKVVSSNEFIIKPDSLVFDAIKETYKIITLNN